ncbi:unnamed protein product [Diatraea saccharalis]|uniref:WW domain-containing protein n=1 Tax=Diatraea saccharalis TaxID=40085 RepID=A0A9N9R1E7_9NEOP|nr:unnamed protein product [Diatraea saccharalis]
MSKANALAGLISNYGDSDEESDDGNPMSKTSVVRSSTVKSTTKYSSELGTGSLYMAPDSTAAIHPAPIPHCPWSACYDESSGFTYYWNQQTNAVTWEAPPEYLLALKLAQQHLNTSGSTEVSAEEWQLYQQALAEKQNSQSKVISKAALVNPVKNAPSKTPISKATKRRMSDDEDVKIELITSYHNSDSDSNDETESPIKKTASPVVPPKLPKTQHKKSKKTSQKPVEYGPTLPPNQNYSVPIGPELPHEPPVENESKLPDKKIVNTASTSEQIKKLKVNDNEDSQDESILLTKLKDKAKILEKLGGEIPVELQKIIQDETKSKSVSPNLIEENKNTKATIDTNIDDLLEEIEKKELPKVKTKTNLDTINETLPVSNPNSPKLNGTPPREVKPLFPSSDNITDEPTIPPSLFPSAANVIENSLEKQNKESTPATEKKNTNVYLMDAGEVIENIGRKKLRISNSVLPVKRSEPPPSYTTKYSQSIDSFSGERTGLGFSKEDEEDSSNNDTAVTYGNGLVFTKGETLNEEAKEEDLDDTASLLEEKLKYLTQIQPCTLSPIQEMMIQMQMCIRCADAARRGGGGRAGRALLARVGARRGAGAAPARVGRGARGLALLLPEVLHPPRRTLDPSRARISVGSIAKSEGRYRYERECDGLVQWEFPATANMDMDICTTPPHPGHADVKESPPPLQPQPQPHPPPAPPATPPPPAWDPPPPGCDDAAPPPLPPEPKQEIGDELLSFYNDIAELEKQTPSVSQTAASSPEPPEKHKDKQKEREKEREKEKDREKDKDRDKDKGKKKSKVNFTLIREQYEPPLFECPINVTSSKSQPRLAMNRS